MRVGSTPAPRRCGWSATSPTCAPAGRKRQPRRSPAAAWAAGSCAGPPSCSAATGASRATKPTLHCWPSLPPPLAAYDEWLARSGPDRWRWLLAAWWCWDRHLSLAGATGVNDKLIPAVWVRGPEPDAELRRRATLAMLPDIDGSVEIDELTDRLCWQQPALW